MYTISEPKMLFPDIRLAAKWDFAEEKGFIHTSEIESGPHTNRKTENNASFSYL